MKVLAVVSDEYKHIAKRVRWLGRWAIAFLIVNAVICAVLGYEVVDRHNRKVEFDKVITEYKEYLDLAAENQKRWKARQDSLEALRGKQ